MKFERRRIIKPLTTPLTAPLLVLMLGCADSPPEYPGVGKTDCTEQGGTCTPDPAVICSPGTQPLYADDPSETNCFGRCCIPQPESSTCNRVTTDTDFISSYNCVPDDESGYTCPSGWAPVEGNRTCEEGRSCCYRP